MNKLILAMAFVCMASFSFCMNEAEFATLKAKAEGGDVESMRDVGNCYRKGSGVPKDENLAFEWMQKAAEKCDVMAIGYLAFFYEIGLGTKCDVQLAMSMYQKAADLGDVRSMCRLAACYGNGDGIKKNPKLSFDWYCKAADKGSALAIGKIGYLYEKGLGVEQSYEKALNWYRQAESKNGAFGIGRLGHLYETGHGVEKSYSKAAICYEKAIKTGDTFSQSALGRLCDLGLGTEMSFTDASYLYKTAADKGDADAQCNYASCLEERWHENRDENVNKRYKYHEQALYWYEKAANQGCPAAILSLWEIGAANSKEKWYDAVVKLAESGNSYAQRALGKLYGQKRNGIVACNKQTSDAWYAKAVKQGNWLAMKECCNRGDCWAEMRKQTCYAECVSLPNCPRFDDSPHLLPMHITFMSVDGNCVLRNTRLVLLENLCMALKGDAIAQYNFAKTLKMRAAECANYMLEFEQNGRPLAVEWARKSAELGNQYAQYMLGCMYKDGDGVDAAWMEAKRWLIV